MEKRLAVLRANQAIVDNYLNFAIEREPEYVRTYRTCNLYINGHNKLNGIKYLKLLGNNDGTVVNSVTRNFYSGYTQSAAIVISCGLYLALRVGKDIFYTGVKNKDRKVVLAMSRKKNQVYDMRILGQTDSGHFGDNVITYSF